LSSNVVAVIEGDRTLLLQCEHRIDVDRHGSHRALDVAVRIFPSQRERVFEGHLMRHVAVQRVVGARLIREHVGRDSTFHDLGQHISAIAD
jgi:hypothetical protein